MRIPVVFQSFRINNLCATLVKHKVTILTGKKNYPAGVIFEEYKVTRIYLRIVKLIVDTSKHAGRWRNLEVFSCYD